MKVSEMWRAVCSLPGSPRQPPKGGSTNAPPVTPTRRLDAHPRS